MCRNIVQKILDAHLEEKNARQGSEVGIRIDQTLTQDATGTMTYLQFEALGFKRVKTEVSVSYIDHNTIQEGFENADDHRYLESIARKYGILFSKAGNGICHQVHLERFGCPGKTLLGSDSHTPTGGGMGMIAIGAGGLDVAVAMGGGLFYLTYPKVIKIELVGKLRPWVAAKDIVLAILEILSTKGNVGTVIEFDGEGVATLSVPQRATITNMGAELGVTTSVFPSDNNTLAFLKAQGRSECFRAISADPDANYDRVITLDLSMLSPRAASPHSPGNVKVVSELANIPVDQVLIGSCTNASYADLMLVAHLLKNRTIAPHISLGVSCGSRQVLQMIARNGALADIIASGARILENSCGFCIGNSMAPEASGVSVRTSNRNFEGRSGTTDAKVYLVSPETAVATSVTGFLTDPTQFFSNQKYPEIDLPENYLIDDSMILKPEPDSEKTIIIRGANIGAPPKNDPCADVITGVVAIKVGDKITTDHIMPAGNRLKYRSNIAKYAEYVFERQDPEFAKRAMLNKQKGIANIIIAGESYGQGSSREHAAICPMFLGVKMVIAKSIERIHHDNLINFGIIPAIFMNGQDYNKIGLNDNLELNEIHKHIIDGEVLVCNNISAKSKINLIVNLSERQRKILLAGGLLNATRNKI
ncbi:MAG: aconitate hydratase [Chitinivibrionales bacterium]|nr:aconitate hydratase [Chitinivibrionales bacterium]